MNSFLLASRVVGECVLIIESLIFLHAKIISHYHSWTKCSSIQQVSLFIAFLDGYSGYNQIVINPEDQLHLHVYLVHMHIGECPLISVIDTTKRLMSSPKCRSVEVINNPVRPGSNHREVNCINYRQQQQQQ